MSPVATGGDCASLTWCPRLNARDLVAAQLFKFA
jgi:hypothetical protein